MYKFDIDTKKKTIIPFFPESHNTSFSVKFNPINAEFTLLSYYFREINRFQLKLNIIDNNTLVIVDIQPSYKSYIGTNLLKGLAKFVNEKGDLQYWIAIEAKDSKFGE